MPTPRRGNLLCLLVAGGLLAACGEAPSDAAAPSSAPTNKPASRRVEDLPPEMVAAVSAADSAIAIGVHFSLNATPVVDQALPVDIVITPHSHFDTVRAHFEGQEGLAVSVGETLPPVSPADAEKNIKHQLVLLPRLEGVYMLTIGVDTESKDGNFTRIFSVPVIVRATPPAQPPPAPAPKAASGS